MCIPSFNSALALVASLVCSVAFAQSSASADPSFAVTTSKAFAVNNSDHPLDVFSDGADGFFARSLDKVKGAVVEHYNAQLKIDGTTAIEDQLDTRTVGYANAEGVNIVSARLEKGGEEVKFIRTAFARSAKTAKGEE